MLNHLGRVWIAAILACLCACDLTDAAPPASPTPSGKPCTGAKCPHAVQVSVGLGQSCAVIDDGTVRCWGAGLPGGTTLGAESRPIPGLSDVVEVRCGNAWSCGRKKDGTVLCWGWNGSTFSSVTPASPGDVGEATAIAVGNLMACAILKDETVRCWGDTVSGKPHTLDGIKGAKAISFGELRGGVILADGSIKYIGEDTFTSVGKYVDLTGIVAAGIQQFEVGNGQQTSGLTGHDCVVLKDGTVQCWGTFSSGQLGDGNADFSEGDKHPVAAKGISNAVQVSVGFGHSCARLADGTARCWGNGLTGELGDGAATTTNLHKSAVPVVVKGLEHAVDIATSKGTQYVLGTTCAVVADGNVYCWGIDMTSGNPGAFHASPWPIAL